MKEKYTMSSTLQAIMADVRVKQMLSTDEGTPPNGLEYSLTLEEWLASGDAPVDREALQMGIFLLF